MSSVDDLVAWLREQLDEDERVANEAIDQGGRGRRGEAHWIVTHPETMPGLIGDQSGDVVTFNGEATTGWSPSRFQAEHIARHDPARVLREVESKRRVLARHHRYGDDNPGERLHADACAGCGLGGDPDWPVTEDINECPELLDMAAGYEREEAAPPGRVGQAGRSSSR